MLFKNLDRKKLALEHRNTIDELVKEHAYARKKVGEPVAAKDRYVKGDKNRFEGCLR